MNSKNSINKNNAKSENTKQNDNESINNFSNVKNIGKNRKRQRKKANSDDPKIIVLQKPISRQINSQRKIKMIKSFQLYWNSIMEKIYKNI